MKNVLLSVIAVGFSLSAGAVELKICRDGRYLVGIPNAHVDFSEGVLAQAGAVQLTVVSRRPGRSMAMYSIQLNTESGFEAIRLISEREGVIAECDSALGL